MTTTLAPSGDATTHAPTHAAPATTAAVVKPIMVAPLPGCVTIDSTKPDDYLAYARNGTPAGIGNTSVQTAESALDGCIKSKKPTPQSACVVGHGDKGLIVTGSGQNAGDKDHHISIDNIKTWAPLFAGLSGGVSNLFLYGCHVGAGTEGAQLLYELARTVNANVYGPTGLIYCDEDGDFALEPFSTWQMATPLAQPAAIDPPDDATGDLAGGHEVRLHVLENVIITSLDQLTSAIIEPHPSTGWTTVGVELADQLARAVHWQKPFALPGQHAALLTGRMKLKFGYGERAIRKVFSVFNHTLLQDEDHPNIFYRAQRKWRDILG
ncbi:DUF4347 domain-containing protein [Caulobacter sp. 1776]|uniref:DUF4347 domain-containing protein n=1 Tax=Caulobacter sp. 1776 TaxID=3156420 RepID=UPI003390AEC2